MVHHARARSLAARIGVHTRGHALLFESRREPSYPASSGWRLLLIVLLLEGILGPRLSILGLLQLPGPPAWLRVLFLLGSALLMVQVFGRVKFSQLGVHSWREWGKSEKSYFLQILVLANAVFSILFAHRWRGIAADPSLWGPTSLVVPTYLLWGGYQELVYRGMLQTELVRRWGTLPGILISNLLYTFGPLHFYHFSGTAALPMFAAIFAIGLYFALLFERSGNLVMVGVFHGIGDVHITGLGLLAP